MHEGHRDRMRERILLSGIESLQPHEVLEYLLYHAIPRKDTNGIAHELISEFGSFNGVLNADYDARRPCQVSQSVFLRRKDRKVLHAVS